MSRTSNDGKSELIRQALEDRVVKEIKVLCPNSKDAIRSLLESVQGDFYLGEWRSELGRISYAYRVHSSETAEKLNKLMEEGHRFSKPSLVKLYSRKELLDYVMDEAA